MNGAFASDVPMSLQLNQTKHLPCQDTNRSVIARYYGIYEIVRGYRNNVVPKNKAAELLEGTACFQAVPFGGAKGMLLRPEELP
jgi:hypothetical protein